MGQIKDITGQKFGKLTVLKDTGKRKNRQVIWLCKCECGKECEVLGGSLRSGHTQSCGCGHGLKNAIDMTGQYFGKIKVLSRAGSNDSRKALWECQCECGNIFIVDGCSLRDGTCTQCKDCKNKITNTEKYKNTSWYKEIYNKKFGHLTAIEPTEDRNNAGRVLWKCLCDCGNPNYIIVPANSLKSGNTQSCGCKVGTSLGEEKIKKILIENNIKFSTQKTFDDLKSPKQSALRFDFAIYDNNNNIIKLIEYDGIQHFKSIDYWGGEEGLNYLQKCDNIKNNYCKSNNIILTRIPYTIENPTLKDIIGEQYDI